MTRIVNIPVVQSPGKSTPADNICSGLLTPWDRKVLRAMFLADVPREALHIVTPSPRSSSREALDVRPSRPLAIAARC